MSDSVKKFLRWTLGVEGAPKFEPTAEDVKTLMAAGISLFAVTLDKYFDDDPTPAQAAELATKVRQTWVQPEGLNPVLAERVILNAYGDEDLVDDVPRTEVARIEHILSYGIRRELKIEDGPALEALLDEVIAVMNGQVKG
ncbi:hypothetical protein [Kineosporia babensis]|uniref:Uncharacterized protein n=1 Tax=Kineosporia babensis TaxID=499548 RepID=A0A9X1SUR8_9ACTN|nr:hypothetical protein [Kineosporia babensis]MCD5312746.1 hypothetical protein [Kineosporia babensis]